jgi:hypothetical protein
MVYNQSKPEGHVTQCSVPGDTIPLFTFSPQKCADCHTHKKVGEVLGFIQYNIPIR